MMVAFLLTLMLAQATPSPAPTSECRHEAHVVRAARPIPKGLPADMPATKAVVKVLIGPDGKVKEASIFKSSGYPAFDIAVVDAARLTVYSPKVVDCKSVEGVYLFSAAFHPRYTP